MADSQPLAEAKSAEAVNAQAVAAEAVENARMAQLKAMFEESQQGLTDSVAQALRQVFGEHQETGRFLDQTKIPFICRDIAEVRKDQKQMKETIEEIKNGMVSRPEFNIVRYIVYGAVLMVLIGFFGSIIIHQIPDATVSLP